jgi:ATP-binding cassette, subfamily B, bacterial
MTNRVPIWHLLWQMIRYAFRLYLVDSALWMFIMGLPAIHGLIIREFFNQLTQNSPSSFSLSAPLTWVALLLAVGVARIVTIFAGRITKTQHRFTMSSLLQRNLLAQLFQRPGAEPLTIDGATVSTGEVISFFRDDAAQIEDNVVGTNEIFGEGIFAFISLVILLTVSTRLTLLVFLPLVTIALVIQSAKTRIKRYRAASRQATQQVTGLVGEMFSAVQAIQVAGAETHILGRLCHLSDQRHQSMVQDQVFTAILQSSLENLVNLGTGLVLLVAAQSGADRLSVGDFALFVYYLAFVTDFLWFLGGFWTLTRQTEVAFNRMDTLVNNGEYEKVSKIVKHAPLYLPDLKGQIPQQPITHAIAAPPYPPIPLQELRCMDLTYSYPGSNRGIAHVNLTIQRGSITVITGQVGAGKTTLLRVILGLLPLQSGAIYWNGTLIDRPDRFFIPPRSAYTPQVPQLFSNTLQENLLLGRSKHEEDLHQAIVHSALDQDLAAMPQGLYTHIGSKGMRLSGGQIQRAATARMLLRQPELVVFDDLSSALDLETEQKLWSRLFPSTSATSLVPAPTYLIVSHRPFVLCQADCIIVLNNGRVEAQGKLDDLNLPLHSK